MNDIKRIWFDEESLYGEAHDGSVYRQSLLWYPGLRNASDEEREKYDFGLDGIHWRELDEDVSFESFFYDDAEPSILQRFFLTHPEISIKGFAKSIDMNAALLNSYINGFKTPSKEQEDKIIKRIHRLGQEMAALTIA